MGIMKISLQPLGAVILTWAGLMILLFVHAFFGRQLATHLVYVGYMLPISFLLVELLRKEALWNDLAFKETMCWGWLLLFVWGLYLFGTLVWDT